MIEVGSSTVKAGFSGDKTPTLVFPSIVGKSKEDSEDEQEDFIVGEIDEEGEFDYSYPIGAKGAIKNWHYLEMLYSHAIAKLLKIKPEASEGIFIIEPLGSDIDRREDFAAMMFETFKVPRIYFARVPAMVMYASGRTSGTVVDIGEITSCISPVYEGFVLTDCVEYGTIGGHALT